MGSLAASFSASCLGKESEIVLRRNVRGDVRVEKEGPPRAAFSCPQVGPGEGFGVGQGRKAGPAGWPCSSSRKF